MVYYFFVANMCFVLFFVIGNLMSILWVNISVNSNKVCKPAESPPEAACGLDELKV